MSSDFVFVEIEPNSDQPIVDGISFNRINKEWNAVKIDFKEPENQITDSSINFWDKLLSIYYELEKIDEDAARNFSQNCISDVQKMLNDNQFKKSRGKIFTFFDSFMKNKNCTFLDISNDLSIPIINSLFACYKDIEPGLLIDFLTIFKADEIKDEEGKIPFYLFLIQTFPNDDLIAETSRSLIIQIILRKKENIDYFLKTLLDSIVDLFCFLSEISPTIFDDSHPTKLCMYLDTIFCHIEEQIINHQQLIEDYTKKLQEKLIDRIIKLSPLIQFETFRFFLSSIHHIKTISIFIQYMIRKDSAFTQNIGLWFTKWATKTLNLISIMIDLRSSALQTAFFYLNDLDHNASIFGFPDYPSSFIQKPEKKIHSNISVDDLSIYQTTNNELPIPTSHVISVFYFISSLFSMFWSLPFQTDELLITIIEKIAGCGNEYTNAFCFTPGKGIYAQTQILILEAKDSEKELKNLMANFVLKMKKILRSLRI